MKWSRKKVEETMPTVPNDTAERLQAIATTRNEIRDIRAGAGRVNAVAESVRDHSAQNHFIERLRLSYGGNQ